MEVATGEEFDVMRRYWKSDDGRSQLVNTNDEGIERVRRGDYAFITDAATAKYIANRRPCDVVAVGEQFGVRSYGFAVPKCMSLAEFNALNTALLEMHEQGDIEVSSSTFVVQPRRQRCKRTNSLDCVIARQVLFSHRAGRCIIKLKFSSSASLL